MRPPKDPEELLIWAECSLLGYTRGETTGLALHAVIEDQLGTSQEAVCGASPPLGSKWLALEGPSEKPVCFACRRSVGTRPRTRRRRKLRLIQGGKK